MDAWLYEDGPAGSGKTAVLMEAAVRAAKAGISFLPASSVGMQKAAHGMQQAAHGIVLVDSLVLLKGYEDIVAKLEEGLKQKYDVSVKVFGTFRVEYQGSPVAKPLVLRWGDGISVSWNIEGFRHWLD